MLHIKDEDEDEKPYRDVASHIYDVRNIQAKGFLHFVVAVVIYEDRYPRDFC